MAGEFDDFSGAYEAMIDWPRRLAGEEGFYRAVFAKAGAQRVLDAACGTGHHAAMFHSWRLSVEGADISPTMIERCRRAWGESGSLRWVVRGFEEPAEAESFDVAVCAGNSLALAGGKQAMARAAGNLLSAVRPGGGVMIHVLNLWRLADGPCVWQKCVRADLNQADSLIIKGVHRCGGNGFVNLLVSRVDADPPALTSESVPFTGVEAGELEGMLRQGGAKAVDVYGGYGGQAYDRASSVDLVAVGWK